MKTLLFISILTPFLFLQSCSTQERSHAQSETKKEMQKNKFDPIKKDEKMTQDKSQLNTKKVKVAKPDGTLQCSQGEKISIAEMQKDLKDITVFSSENKSDGRMRIQMCGSPTGLHNVYEILEGDLNKAKALGFELWNS